MDLDFWHQRWERSEIGFHQHTINRHLQQFSHHLQLPAGKQVFVPLCGKSHDLLWLAGEGHSVLGVEISPIAVATFFQEHGLAPKRWQDGVFEVWEQDEIRILLGDFFALEPRHLADVGGVYDRAALIALPPDMRKRYVHTLDTLLPLESSMLLVTLEYEQALLAGPPFAVSAAEVQALYGRRYQIELIDTRDALAEESRWRDRGLTWLLEKAYHLTPQTTATL